MDAESFLGWATAAGRETRLSQLAEPARRFLLNGGDYAHDIVDRTLDLLGRLAEPDPDLDGVGLPGYMLEAAKAELAAGQLDLSGHPAGRRSGGQGAMLIGRQVQPRIALDPYGQGVHVLLPAVDDLPAGAAPGGSPRTGDTHPVHGRAMRGPPRPGQRRKPPVRWTGRWHGAGLTRRPRGPCHRTARRRLGRPRSVLQRGRTPARGYRIAATEARSGSSTRPTGNLSSPGGPRRSSGQRSRLAGTAGGCASSRWRTCRPSACRLPLAFGRGTVEAAAPA